MLVPRVEHEHNFSVPLLGDLDAVRVELRLEQVDLHACKQVALSEGVRDRALLARVDLCNYEDVVEEEHLALVYA